MKYILFIMNFFSPKILTLDSVITLSDCNFTMCQHDLRNGYITDKNKNINLLNHLHQWTACSIAKFRSNYHWPLRSCHSKTTICNNCLTAAGRRLKCALNFLSSHKFGEHRDNRGELFRRRYSTILCPYF